MIWITGNNGALAQTLQLYLSQLSIDYVSSSRSDCDLQDVVNVETFYNKHLPKYIFHCAAFTNVDLASIKQADALLDNFLTVQNLIRTANTDVTKIIFFSSDYVFDGLKPSSYTEVDPPNPVQFYGKTKLLAEKAFLKDYPNYLIIRLSWLYNLQKGFPHSILQMVHNDSISVVTDEIGSPTFIPYIIKPIVDVSLSPATGTYHIASEGSVSRYDLAQETLKLARKANLITTQPGILSITSKDFQNTHPKSVKRPSFSALDSSKVKNLLQIYSLGTWQEHLTAYINALANQ